MAAIGLAGFMKVWFKELPRIYFVLCTEFGRFFYFSWFMNDLLPREFLFFHRGCRHRLPRNIVSIRPTFHQKQPGNENGGKNMILSIIERLKNISIVYFKSLIYFK